MNYQHHYNQLINRSQNRVPPESKEVHHILPRCLGGSDDDSNLVSLTPEEHYVAHQLLAKMYPDNRKLLHAATMMCSNSQNLRRGNNKLYGWLRRRLSSAISDSQSGQGNSQFGTCWVSNLTTKESIKVSKEMVDQYLSEGWVKKRIINWDNQETSKPCPQCGKEFVSRGKTCSIKCGRLLSNRVNPRKFAKGKLNELLASYAAGNSIYKCLTIAGLDGTGQNHVKLKRIIEDLNIKRGVV